MARNNTIETAERAVNRYTRALHNGASPGRADGDVDQQAGNYRRASQRASLRATQIKQAAYAHGITPMQVLAYVNYGFHLDRLVRHHGGKTLCLRAQEAVQRWLGYGLRRDVLEAIARDVFTLDLGQSDCPSARNGGAR